MKKGFSILLSLLILVSSSGFSFSIDNCQYKKKTTLTTGAEKSCCCATKKPMKGCCHKTTVVIEKIKDSYTPATSTQVLPKIPAAFILPSNEIFCFLSSSKRTPLLVNDKAPPNQTVPYTILYCSILI